MQIRLPKEMKPACSVLVVLLCTQSDYCSALCQTRIARGSHRHAHHQARHSPRITAADAKALPCRVSSPSLMLRGGANFITGLPAHILLAATILLEILATTSMKLAATRSPLWYAGVFIGYVLCFSIFPIALRTLPLGIAYATWSGVGTAASVAIGAVLFAEKLTPLKLFCLVAIILGVVGLNL